MLATIEITLDCGTLVTLQTALRCSLDLEGGKGGQNKVNGKKVWCMLHEIQFAVLLATSRLRVAEVMCLKKTGGLGHNLSRCCSSVPAIT